MANGKNVHTTYNSSTGVWENKYEGHSQVINSSALQSVAYEAGQELAKAEKSEWIGHKKDGTIGQRNSYGNDPYPPRG